MAFTVVGAGISGLSCARALLDAGRDVLVTERDAALGGRMAAPRLRGRPVDIGAAYFTVSDPAFAAAVEDWSARGLVRPWTDTLSVAGPGGITSSTTGPMRYAAPSGLAALVEDIARSDGDASGGRLRITTGSPVRRVERGPRLDGQPVDAVVLAMPDPQATALLERPPVQLQTSEWEPVLTVVLTYRQRRWPSDFHAAFVNDHDVLSFVADDGDRRGDGAPVLVAHTTAEYAARRLGAAAGADATPDSAQVESDVRRAVAAVLDLDTEPIHISGHPWVAARPARPHEQLYWLSEGIGVCGDGWGGTPRVQTAWLSGRALAAALTAG